MVDRRGERDNKAYARQRINRLLFRESDVVLNAYMKRMIVERMLMTLGMKEIE